MGYVSFAFCTTIFLFLVVPWCLATLFAWIYAELVADAEGDNAKIGRLMAIIQTFSIVIYIFFIPFSLFCIGYLGRRSMWSFLCLVVGMVVFSVVPILTGGFILVTSQTSDNGDSGFGLVTGIFCLLSTMACLSIVCCAILFGSKGRAKKHRFPIPLAYLPFLKDFWEIEERNPKKEIDDHNRYTGDYPPPRYTFPDRKPVSVSAWTNNVNMGADTSGSKATNKQDNHGNKGGDTSVSKATSKQGNKGSDTFGSKATCKHDKHGNKGGNTSGSKVASKPGTHGNRQGNPSGNKASSSSSK